MECVHIRAGICTLGQKRVLGLPLRAEVEDVCERLAMGAENQPQVLCKTRMCSYPPALRQKALKVGWLDQLFVDSRTDYF